MNSIEKAIFGGGCFWCSEAIFLSLKGVISVMPGYAGGKVENPTYEQVCSGATGHVESIEITFDSEQIKYETLVQVFFGTHNPTTLNRQGNDVGEQYRSVIFFTSAAQKIIAEKVIADLTQQQVFDNPIVTTVEPFTNFFPAEDYHRNYYANNQDQPYCQAIISPKLAKFRKQYSSLLK